MSEIDETIIYSTSGVESTAYELGDGDFTVAVIGENHGDEQGPREVFDEIFRDLPEAYDDLSLSYIPEANSFASRETTRKTPRSFQPNAADEHDLNRSYETAREELENGEMQRLNTTQQAAFHVLEYLDELEPDLVVDMHTGTSGTEKMPQIRYKHRSDYPVDEDVMRGVTENAGVDMVVSEPVEDAEMLGAVAPKMGFPAVTIEVGGGLEYGRSGFGDEEAESYQDVLMNIFDYALRGEETDFRPREFSGLEKNFAPHEVEAGEVEYHFPLGEEVLEGETVATLTTESGEEHELEALTDGVLETVLTEDKREDVKPGNRVFNIALRE